MSKYDLKAVLNESFEPVKYRLKGKPHRQVFLSIKSDDGDPDLDNVSLVQYELHPTFKNRVRVSRSPKDNFETEIKTWGTFPVKVTVFMKDGQVETFTKNYKDVLERDSF